MTIKKTVIATSFLLAMGSSLSGFSETKTEMVDGDAVTIECISAAELDSMSDEDKSKLTIPVCEDMENTEKEATTTQ